MLVKPFLSFTLMLPPPPLLISLLGIRPNSLNMPGNKSNAGLYLRPNEEN